MKKMILLICLLFLVGCQSSYSLPEQDDQPTVTEQTPDELEETIDVEDEVEDEIDLQIVRPNEAGQVMVLMYHEIGGTEATWRRTTENFRSDMETLYNEGYRPVNLNDFLGGNINIPAGTTPFILTFDDGSAGQFRFLDENDEPVVDPDSAISILLEMSEKYDDFEPAGTFFIYYPLPFRQQAHIQTKLELLVEWGFEIGNHTHGHENLRSVSQDEAVKALARHVQATQQYLPQYSVNTLALPYGALPADDSYLISGTWDDTTYENNAILLVGANPSPSPFTKKFNPYRLPRIRADGTELPRWLQYFENNPDERYISDGNPEIVTLPLTHQDQIDPTHLNNKTLRTYTPE